jgi:16S rRNA (uracil1498-N3)-methyltransferase
LTLVDGSGSRFEGEIVDFAAERVEIHITRRRPPEPAPSPRLLLVYGISKRARTEWVLQKATELGVDWLLPATTERSVSRLTDGGAGRKLERWHQITADAARQCGRALLPLVSAPQPLEQALGRAADSADCCLLATPGGAPLADHTSRVADPANRAVAVAVGPEGGFSGREVQLGGDRGFLPVNLGPLTLRTETAALALLTLTAHFTGRLHLPAPEPV